MNNQKALLERRQKLVDRFAVYNIKQEIAYLPYLDYSDVTFQLPVVAAQRMMILYTVSYLAHEPYQREGATDWLHQEGLWDQVSNREREFLTKLSPTEEDQMMYSWQAESVYTLAWALGLLNTLIELA